MKACGIDLGTTYSAISWYDVDNDRVNTIELVNAADGQPIIRSVVYYPSGEAPVVGDTAWNAARQHPERVVVGIKRSMGDPNYHFSLDGENYSPQKISSEILKVLVQEAETYIGESVTDVVITVPAYFGDNECSATREAGELAGLNVLSLMAEPHAAALAYVVEKAAEIDDQDLLVYDLGGGTFDITLIHATALTHQVSGDDGEKELPSLRMTTITKEGNSALGGLDWDRALAELIREKVDEEHGVDVMADPKDEAFLLDGCEKAKRHLSRTASVNVVADMAGHSVEVSRMDFEERTEGLLFQTECLVEQVLKDAVTLFQDRARKEEGLSDEEVEKIDLDFVKGKVGVMLTGGSSKMPMVRNMLERIVGKKPIQYGNPELLVTKGAAYFAYIESLNPVGQSGGSSGGQGGSSGDSGDGAKAPRKTTIEIIDTTPSSIGVEALRSDSSGGRRSVFVEIIAKNSRYGNWFQKDFQKAEDNATEITIEIYKGDGESDRLEDCSKLADFTISGLPPGGREGEMVRVELICENGMLRGRAVDLASGKSADVEGIRPFESSQS